MIISYFKIYHIKYLLPENEIFYCSITKLYQILCDLMDRSMPGFPVFHCLSKFAQIHVPWVSDAI